MILSRHDIKMWIVACLLLSSFLQSSQSFFFRSNQLPRSCEFTNTFGTNNAALVGAISAKLYSTKLHFQPSVLGEEGLLDARLMTKEEAYSIRPAKFTDLPSVVQLRMGVFFPAVSDDLVFQRRLLEKLRLRYVKGSLILMALKNNQMSSYSDHPIAQIAPGVVLGTIECSGMDFTNTSLANFGCLRKLYIGDLAVRQEARQLGIASKLLEIIDDYANQEEYGEVYLHVELENLLARRLYANRGYEELQPTAEIVSFTEQHLQRPAHSYVMLRKQYNNSIKVYT